MLAKDIVLSRLEKISIKDTIKDYKTKIARTIKYFKRNVGNHR